MNERLDSPRVEALGYVGIETIYKPTLDRDTSKNLERIVETFLRKVGDDHLDDLFHVLPRRVNDCVRTRVKRVRRLALAALFERDAVVLCDDGDDRATDVVHVENGWVGVERDGVELVRVFHRDGCERIKVVVLDGFCDAAHSIGDDGETL